MKLLTILVFLFSISVYSQNCDCKSDFEWVKKTFEENDAGFQYIIDTKGNQSYDLHNQIFSEKINDASSLTECNQIINEWLKYFRNGHVAVQILAKPESSSEEGSQGNDVDSKTVEWESNSTNIDQFKKYLDGKEVNDIEGIWEIGSYKIAIKKESNQYVGFIVESKFDEWKKGQVKLKIFDDRDLLKSEFYMFDRSAVKSDVVSLLSTNNLQLGNFYLKRTFPVIDEDSPYDLFIKAMESSLPFMERLNSSTLYFRIPSFLGTPEKLAIDSVIAANKDQMLSTENLIIDIRNGTGGSDISYSGILPFLYTNPIRIPAVEYLSTPLNNQRMLDFSKNEGLAIEFNVTFSEEERKEYKRHYEYLSKHLGEFVNLGASDVNITRLDSVYPYPQNVGIMHNHRNGSTDEQFLLDARQSRKVKLFGTPTMGVIDVSNMSKVVSPCGDFVLWYALTKSLRVPEMAVDNVGVQPDYYIDSEIPDYKWVEFVVDVLNE